MKKINYVVIATTIFLAGFMSSCKKENVSPDMTSTTADMRSTEPNNGNMTVQITNGSFNPRVVNIVAGYTVTWQNDEATVQTVTADDESFDSGDIQPGQSFSMVVTAVGQHPYHSRYNSSMIGSLNVAGIK
ncbi:MAG: cupredoxin domain-containing protein [Ferruginibacter sp.]